MPLKKKGTHKSHQSKKSHGRDSKENAEHKNKDVEKSKGRGHLKENQPSLKHLDESHSKAKHHHKGHGVHKARHKHHKNHAKITHEVEAAVDQKVELMSTSAINLDEIINEHWTLKQDRAIVRGRCFNKKENWQEIDKQIQRTSHDRHVTEAILKERLHALESTPSLSSRFDLLKLSVEDEVLQKGPGAAASFGVFEPFMKKQGVESPTKRREGDGNLQIKCHSKSSRGREPPTLQAVKSQVERSSKLLKAVLTHDREVLGDLLIGGLSADPCVRYDHGNSVLSFHENCGEFKNEVTNGFCDSDVLECFLRFAEDPTLTSRFKENVQKLRKFIKRESIVKDEFQNSLDMELNNVADELHKKQKEEVEVSLDSLEEQRLAEIRKVNEKYDALKVQQQEVWKKTHDEQQFIVKNMFKGDSDFALRVASSKIQRKRKNILKKSVATIEEDMKSVFHYQTLVRLLVLSEYLHVEHLRDACMEQLTRAPGSYEKELILANIDSPALNSSLLDPFTIRSMIQRLSNRGLFELIAQGDLFAFCELARREYDARIRDAEDKYTQLKNDELLQLSNTLEKLKMEKQTKFRGDSWYPDLDDVPDGFTNDVVDVEDQIVEPAGWRAIPFENALLHEMQRRRSYSSVRINKDNLPSTMKLEYNGTVLSLTKPFQYATAHATLPRRAHSYGKWIFEIKILVCPSFESSVAVGFDVPREHVSWKPSSVAATPRGAIETIGQIGQRGVAVPGITVGGHGRAGIAWKSDGKRESSISLLNVNGKSFSWFESFAKKDVITITLNQDCPIPFVQFYKNGEKMIASDKCQKYLRGRIKDRYWKEKREHLNLEGLLMDGDLPLLDYENYELLPAVCLYSSLRNGSPRVSCNFGGPFEYPVEGHEGYGASIDKKK